MNVRLATPTLVIDYLNFEFCEWRIFERLKNLFSKRVFLVKLCIMPPYFSIIKIKAYIFTVNANMSASLVATDGSKNF